MIVDKHKPIPLEEVILPEPPRIDNEDAIEKEDNPLTEVYRAIRRTLESLHVDPHNPHSDRLFQTVKVDNGQFERIVRNNGNTEYGIAFPAAFVRFTNVRYLVQQQRIGEGRATLRIRYILNNLNTSDDDIEIEGFERFQQINTAIQDAKDKEPAINERCNLTFFDMPESLDHGLQPYWIDYEIWFRDTSSFQYRNWVERYIVMPPFTNHSDAPEHDTEGHGDHHGPQFDNAVDIQPSVEAPQPEIPEDSKEEDFTTI